MKPGMHGSSGQKESGNKIEYDDLVCGMSTEDESAFLKYEYKGKTYYFCSNHCLEEFKAAPDKFI